MTSSYCDFIYGFVAYIDLTPDECQEFASVGIATSPRKYNEDGEIIEYSVGKKITHTQDIHQLESELTEQKKEEFRSWLLASFSKIGLHLDPKQKLSLIVTSHDS